MMLALVGGCSPAADTPVVAAPPETPAPALVPTPPRGLFFQTFRALGNEPSWVLEITPQLLELRTELGTRRSDFPYRAPTVAGARTTYRSFSGTEALVVVIDRVPCNDTMSGELFASTVVVTFEGTTLHGCGRNPGMPW